MNYDPACSASFSRFVSDSQFTSITNVSHFSYHNASSAIVQLRIPFAMMNLHCSLPLCIGRSISLLRGNEFAKTDEPSHRVGFPHCRGMVSAESNMISCAPFLQDKELFVQLRL